MISAIVPVIFIVRKALSIPNADSLDSANPDIPVFVKLGPERVFVVIAVNAPIVVQRFEMAEIVNEQLAVLVTYEVRL